MESAAKRGPRPKPNVRENLVAAGLHLFRYSGYTPTGIQDITDHAKVPKGSFYNHFDSKESFGVEVVDAYAKPRDLLLDNSVPPLRRLEMDFDRKIERFIRNGFTGGCLLGNFGAELSEKSEAIRERVGSHFDKWSHAIAVCVEEAQQDGSIKTGMPAERLARFVLNSWEGALIDMKVEKNDKSLRLFKEMIFGSLLK